MKIIGIDPSFRNTAFVMCNYKNYTLTNPVFHQIDSKNDKSMRQYQFERDFDSCLDIVNKTKLILNNSKADIIFVESPTGSQSARACIGYAVSWMIIALVASHFSKAKIHLIKPRDVKSWATGNSKANKREMIEAAEELAPNFPWRRNKNGIIKSMDEHRADATLTLLFGIETYL